MTRNLADAPTDVSGFGFRVSNGATTRNAKRETRSPELTRFKRVVVVGLGYVGLPTALMLARAGIDVVGFDVDEARVAEVAAGDLHRINEPEIQSLAADPQVRRHLTAQTRATPADGYILAVPTPITPKRKHSDLSFLVAATRSILPHLQRGNLVVVESTVPPQTCRQVVARLIEEVGFSTTGDSPDVLVAHCPERVLPGNIAHELVHNQRIIGGVTPAAAAAARDLYRTFVKGDIHLTDDLTAEFCKLVENTYRDVNIALANELSAVAEGIGVEAKEAFALANCHPRVHVLSPGIGVGGHCIPVDPWFIWEIDPQNSRLISVARSINDQMPARTASHVRRALAGIASPKIVAIGATYKPNTYDLRESPALEVVHLLHQDGYDVSLHDPLTKEYPCPSLREVARGADCLAILVPHSVVTEELAAHHGEILRVMRQPIVLTF